MPVPDFRRLGLLTSHAADTLTRRALGPLMRFIGVDSNPESKIMIAGATAALDGVMTTNTVHGSPRLETGLQDSQRLEHH